MTKSKKLTATLLKSLEIEYMTTKRSIEELEAIYNVEIPKDKYLNWKKVPEPVIPELLEPLTLGDTPLDADLEEVKIRIKGMKKELLDKIDIRIMSLDEYSDIKDLKDLASTLDMLEKSYDNKKPVGNVINLTMQFAALISKYEQDC